MVVRPLANGIKGWVGESHRYPAPRALFVGQGEKAGPERRGGAGTHHGVIAVVRIAGIALVSQNENIGGHHGNIGYVTQEGGPAIGNHADTLLVGRDGDARTNTAPAGVGDPLQWGVPGGFRKVRLSRTLHRQLGAAHYCHLDEGTQVDRRGHRRDGVPRHIGAVIPGGLEEGLALSRELLEDGRCIGVTETGPGTADLVGKVVGCDLLEHQVGRGVGGGGAHLINPYLGKSGRHGNGHLDIERDLHDAVRITPLRLSAKTTDQDVGHGHVRQPCQAFIALDVGQVITFEFHQGNRLSRAREADPGHIGVPKISPPIKTRGGRPAVCDDAERKIRNLRDDPLRD